MSQPVVDHEEDRLHGETEERSEMVENPDDDDDLENADGNDDLENADNDDDLENAVVDDDDELNNRIRFRVAFLRDEVQKAREQGAILEQHLVRFETLYERATSEVIR